MNERIHACLDGDLPEEALNPEERAEVEALRSLATKLRRALPVAGDELAPVVMRRIEQLGLRPDAPQPVRKWLAAAGSSLWSPRRVELRLRPAYALLLAVAMVTSLWIGTTVRGGGAAEHDAVSAEPARPPIYVQFRLDASGASNVALAGSFTEWRPDHQLVQSGPGIWTLIVPLPPGVHDYAFVVDGERWVADPAALQVDDGFGGVNSRIALLPSVGGAL